MFLLRSDFQYFLAGDDKASTTLEREFVSAQTEISRDLANNIQALESVHAVSIPSTLFTSHQVECITGQLGLASCTH